MAKVSILLCCYNQKSYLAKAIESALTQTHSDIELVIMDNGSTDGSHELLETYRSDPRIKLVLHQKNEFMTKTSNEGLRLCTGEFVSQLYGDDYYLPEKIEKQLQCFQKLPKEVGVVYSPGYRLNVVTGEKWIPPMIQKSGWVLEEMLCSENLGGRINPISPLIRRECFEKYPFREEIFHESEEIFIRFAIGYQFYYLDEPLVVMTDHETNLGKAFKYNQVNSHRLSAALMNDPEFPSQMRGVLRAYMARTLFYYAWQGIRVLEDTRWARSCVAKAWMLFTKESFRPKAIVCTLLSLLPSSLLHGINRIISSLRGTRQVALKESLS